MRKNHTAPISLLTGFAKQNGLPTVIGISSCAIRLNESMKNSFEIKSPATLAALEGIAARSIEFRFLSSKASYAYISNGIDKDSATGTSSAKNKATKFITHHPVN